MNAKTKLREFIENKVEEGYQKLVTLQPSEAFKEYGYWLDPAEYRIIEGVKHYREIRCNYQKGGWRPGYGPKPLTVDVDRVSDENAPRSYDAY